MTEAALVERQDRIPRLDRVGDPRAEPCGLELVPVNVRVTATQSTRGASNDVTPEVRELVFEGLAFELLAWHVKKFR
jgi:hypothetical protein